MTTYVLDASAGADLLLDTDVGRSLLANLQPGAQWWVPEHYFVEVASVVRRAELTGVISTAMAMGALTALVAAPLHRVQLRPLLETAWTRRGHLTVHDALYVVLAERVGGVLVTSDRRLARSPVLTVPVVLPP